MYTWLLIGKCPQMTYIVYVCVCGPLNQSCMWSHIPMHTCAAVTPENLQCTFTAELIIIHWKPAARAHLHEVTAPRKYSEDSPYTPFLCWTSPLVGFNALQRRSFWRSMCHRRSIIRVNKHTNINHIGRRCMWWCSAVTRMHCRRRSIDNNILVVLPTCMLSIHVYIFICNLKSGITQLFEWRYPW